MIGAARAACAQLTQPAGLSATPYNPEERGRPRSVEKASQVGDFTAFELLPEQVSKTHFSTVMRMSLVPDEQSAFGGWRRGLGSLGDEGRAGGAAGPVMR